MNRKNEVVKDNISAIFEIIKNLCNYRTDKSVEIATLKKRVLARGHPEDTLEITLNHYENLDVLMYDGDKIRLIE